jgi:hypothetical protein
VQFSEIDFTVREPHLREALALSPASKPEESNESWEFSDLPPNCDRLDVGNLAKDFEGHHI